MLDHTNKLIFSLINAYNLISLDFCYPHAIHELTLFIQVKVKIVCEDDIVECLLVTVELFFMTVLVTSVKVVVVNVLSLYKEHWQMIFLS